SGYPWAFDRTCEPRRGGASTRRSRGVEGGSCSSEGLGRADRPGRVRQGLPGVASRVSGRSRWEGGARSAASVPVLATGASVDGFYRPIDPPRRNRKRLRSIRIVVGGAEAIVTTLTSAANMHLGNSIANMTLAHHDWRCCNAYRLGCSNLLDYELCPAGVQDLEGEGRLGGEPQNLFP